ncbi:MAG: IS701 family transposase [Chloroflexi bacterium]|nr:IS701 family transposase [Chloroflexota bacterium]
MRTIINAGPVVPPPSGRPPAGNLVPADVAALADELVAYHAEFAPLFRRAEQRHWALAYLHGQLLHLERKSIEPMALALPDGDVQALQQFISQGAWDDERLLERHQLLVAKTLGDSASGVLILDGCDFPKQGRHSVGVARQWCGALGKVANCQASVVAAYASARGYTLVDRRLFLPEAWFDAAHRQLRTACGVPDDLVFQSHTELAWEIVQRLRARHILPFDWVLCDEGFGKDPLFLDRLDGASLLYLAEVPHSTRLWLSRPPTWVPPARGKKGRPPRKERLAPGAAPPERVDALAAHVPAQQWQLYQIKEGTKGPLVAEFAFLRGVVVRDEMPGAESWLVLRRSVDERRELKTYLSNAPATTPETTLVTKSGMRWCVEAGIEESKGECGLDHYEVRGWVGWHHHTALTFLAHHFLVRQRCRLGKKIGGVDGAAGAGVAAGGLTTQAPGCRDRDWADSVPPRAELRGLRFAPPPDAAAPRQVVTN